VSELREWRRASEWAGEQDLVFPSLKGTPVIVENLRRRVLRPAAEEAGASCAAFHTFRHTCGSMLFEGGKSAKQVQTEARQPRRASPWTPTSICSATGRASRSACAELEKCHGSEEPTGFSQLAVLARHFSTDDAVRPEA
jgi:hypothetical protein